MKRDRDLTNKLSLLISLQAQSYEVMKNLDNRRDQLAKGAAAVRRNFKQSF